MNSERWTKGKDLLRTSGSLRMSEKRRKGVYKDFNLDDLRCKGSQRWILEIPKAKLISFAFPFSAAQKLQCIGTCLPTYLDGLESLQLVNRICRYIDAGDCFSLHNEMTRIE